MAFNYIDQTRLEDLEARVEQLEDYIEDDDECNCWKNNGSACVAHLFDGKCYYDR